MRHSLTGSILAHRDLGDAQFEMTVLAPDIARDARPGQFLQALYVGAGGPLMRRPFSVFHADPEAGTLAIVYVARGAFTIGMSALRVGCSISLVGPLGNCFVPDARPAARHLLVAGGVGAPPLYFLAREMVAAGHAPKSICVINGARSRDLLVAGADFAALGVTLRETTDDGSAGRRGTVADELRDQIAAGGPCSAYACGPTPMLRAVGSLCVEAGVACRVSLETVMPCGLGVCMGCVIKLRNEAEPEGHSLVRSCHEGPIFDASEVIW
ncbi:MAG: dihydroorotate dehydrogenase electron transfer subunit [Armatimonadetes bacterium]|nr:dihydroorotate dehydrogenase electron transfer subunit [Armatimonadota bacterium]